MSVLIRHWPEGLPRFVTTEQGVSSWLIHKGFRCQVSVDLDRKVAFTFIDTPALRSEIQNYAAGAMVSAILYDGAQRVLRRLIGGARNRLAVAEVTRQ